jgi:glycerol-3-phosphate dehydrogenase
MIRRRVLFPRHCWTGPDEAVAFWIVVSVLTSTQGKQVGQRIKAPVLKTSETGLQCSKGRIPGAGQTMRKVVRR